MANMLSPIPLKSFTTSAPTVYTADKNGIIPNVSTPQDVADLVAAGCAQLSPPPTDLLFTLKGANFNVGGAGAVGDQILTPSFIGKWRIRRITVTNASISLTTVVGGFYTAAAKGGSAVVANSQVYSSLTGSLLALDCTLALPNLVLVAGTPLYFSPTTPQGAAATGDIYVYGDVYQ